MSHSDAFQSRVVSPARKFLVMVALYVACVTGGVALAHFAGTTTASIPGPGYAATG